MTTYTGGLRARLIHDSLEEMLRTALDARGWFDAGRNHQPITIASAPAEWDEAVEWNTLAVCQEDVNDDEAELGSLLTDDTWTVYVDFYAESEVLGIDVINDVRDILRGKMASVGREGPVLDVYDYTLATPVVIFSCQILNVVLDRAHNFTKPWQRYWFTARCELEDTYADEAD